MTRPVLSSVLAGAMALAITFPALAHGPTPQRASHAVHVDASPKAVWQIVRDPASLAAWHPAVSSVAIDGEGRGAKRTVTMEAGGSVVDGIDDVNEERMNIRWRLSQEDIDVVPVSYYTNDLTVTADGEGANVEWGASFFRADTTNEPEERYSDEAAVEAMERYVEEGLAGLKKMAEKDGSM